MSANGQNQGTEYKLRVKSGDLAAQGPGSVAIRHTPDGRFYVRLSLPDEKGTHKPLDLTTIERVELVETKTGWFKKGEWVKPLVATAAGVIGVPLVGTELLPSTALGTALWGGATLAASYASGVYTGTKLTRMARFVVTTQDDKHVVLEGPESVFCFMNGVYAAPNIQLEEEEPETSSEPSEDSVETPAEAPEPATA